MSINLVKKCSTCLLLFYKPQLFFIKIKNMLERISKEFFIDKNTLRMIRHNRDVWKGWAPQESEKIIITEFHNLAIINVPTFYFLNVLGKKKGARIVSFGRSHRRLARAIHHLYRSWNVSGHISTSNLSPAQKARRDALFLAVSKDLKTKEDVFNIQIDGLNIGIDIYETYLREYNKPTVEIDKKLFVLLRWSIGVLVFWQDYLTQHPVIAVAASHDCYVDSNVLFKVAYQKKIPVYLPFFIKTEYAKRPFSKNSECMNYKAWFETLTEQEKKAGMAVAQEQLEKRFRGEWSADTGYMKISAFQSTGEEKPVLRKSAKIKVLICSHCFYDNPHTYGGMIFIDFYEWLKFLSQIARKTDYDWYLKTHADPLPGTLETIEGILGKDSPITVIAPRVTHHQLIKEGLNFVLTAYGSVGHEYPALGVQVINAGYNPHASFDFTWTPKNITEYEKWLMDLGSLKKTIKLEEIYQFYYMHFYFCRIDDLVFDSFRRLIGTLTMQQKIASDLYDYFLKTWDPKRHQKSIERFSDFIDSGKQHLYIKGPMDELIPYVKGKGYLS